MFVTVISFELPWTFARHFLRAAEVQ